MRMCLATSNNLLLVLQDAPKRIFSPTNSRSSVQPDMTQRHFFFHPPSPFHGNFCNCNSGGHLYCFAILGSSGIVIHSVQQRLLRNRPGSALRTSRDILRERLQRAFTSCKTSFTEPPQQQQTPEHEVLKLVTVQDEGQREIREP